MNALKLASTVAIFSVLAACGNAQVTSSDLQARAGYSQFVLKSQDKLEVIVTYTKADANKREIFQGGVQDKVFMVPTTADTSVTLEVARIGFRLRGDSVASRLEEFSVTTYCPGQAPQTLKPHGWGPTASWELFGLFSIVVPTKVWQHNNVVGQLPVACKTELSAKRNGKWEVDPYHANEPSPANHNFILDLK